MIRQTGFVCLLFTSLLNGIESAELPVSLAQEGVQSSSDPLGVRLVRLCRQNEAQPVAQQLRQEIQETYSPRHLERLLAFGNVEARRAAALGIGLVGDLESQTPIAAALKDPDEEVRRQAEKSCHQIWVRLGTLEQQVRLASIQEAITNQELPSAAAQLNLLIQLAPEYAEAWHERAVVYFQMNRYLDSIADCRRVLELNPYHFGAASWMAQCHLKLDQIPEAIIAFKHTARLHPRLPGLEEQISILEELVRQK